MREKENKLHWGRGEGRFILLGLFILQHQKLVSLNFGSPTHCVGVIHVIDGNLTIGQKNLENRLFDSARKYSELSKISIELKRKYCDIDF